MKEKPFAKDVFGNSVFMAETKSVDKNRSNIDRLLLLIGKYMGWKDISHVFVSDLSTLSDFGRSSKEIKAISKTLGFSLKQSDYLKDIAAHMSKNEV